MPTLARIPLADIDEPAVPVRCEMDEQAMCELVESMRSLGLLQPIGLKITSDQCLECGVRRAEHGDLPTHGLYLEGDLHGGEVAVKRGVPWHAYHPRYEIEFGHRRFIAATRLRWRDIPAIIFETSELQEGAAMIAENSHREAVNAAEEGLLFCQAAERYSLDEAGLMKRFNVSADYLGDRMRLVRMGGKVFDALRKRQIRFTVARELNKCDDLAQREYFLDCAIRGQTGSRVVADWIRDWRLHVTPPSTSSTALPAPTESAVDSGDALACVLCGGKKDAWNLVSVYIHKRELADMIAAFQQAADA